MGVGCTQGWGRGCARRCYFPFYLHLFGGAVAAQLCAHSGSRSRRGQRSPEPRPGGRALPGRPRAGSFLRVGSSGQVQSGACVAYVCTCVCIYWPAPLGGRGRLCPFPGPCGPPRAHGGSGSPSHGDPRGRGPGLRSRPGELEVPGLCPGGALSSWGSVGVQGTPCPSRCRGCARGAGDRWGHRASCDLEAQGFPGGGLGEGRRAASAGVRLEGGCPVEKLGNCFASVVCGNNTLSSADKVRFHEGRSVRESKAARHSAPGALISCDTKSISLAARCDGVNRGIGCEARKGASSIFFFFFGGRCRFLYS